MTRVIRRSDGKIFSSPRGVALEAGLPISKSVEYCCKGYLFSVEGERYDWFYDNTDKGKVVYDETYWNRKGKWTSRAWVLKWRAQFIKIWLDKVEDPHRWRRSAEIAEGISEAADDSDEQYKWTPTSTGISKHLHTYKDFYFEVFGMHERQMSNPIYTGRIFKFISADADVEYDSVLKELANDRNWGRGKPVIRTDDNSWYRSMSEAERITQAPYYFIFHCCEGDIPYVEVPLTGERMTFKYAAD